MLMQNTLLLLIDQRHILRKRVANEHLNFSQPI